MPRRPAAAVLKYADNVIRSLATASSIAALYSVNVMFLGWKANLTYIAGCGVVFCSSYLYMQVPPPPILPLPPKVGATLAAAPVSERRACRWAAGHILWLLALGVLASVWLIDESDSWDLVWGSSSWEGGSDTERR
jgi:hypothetical protein